MTEIVVKGHRPNSEFNYPKEFLNGRVDKVRFICEDHNMEFFVEAESRRTRRDIKLGVNVPLVGEVIHTFARAEEIVCDAYSRVGDGRWRAHQPDVLYIVEDHVYRYYRIA